MTDLHEAALAVQAQETGIDNLRNALNIYESSLGLRSELHAVEQLAIAARPDVLRRLIDVHDQVQAVRGRKPLSALAGCHDAAMIDAGDTEGGSCD